MNGMLPVRKNRTCMNCNYTNIVMAIVPYKGFLSTFFFLIHEVQPGDNGYQDVESNNTIRDNCIQH